ncbi:tetratricopeptide repeat protein [Roseomonas sp. GC11]|uniref:tetratricopeptide repeat protein n=1 Tax=Roseomonas sp. GC11 TaxID=2950546 RepID=UPI00272DEDE5|nr:tetratricopeptide repeat protein [Roseomonas sp. GC11]
MPASPRLVSLVEQATRHHQAGRLDEAVAAYRQAAGLDPSHPGIQNNLGVALRQQGRLEEAVACYQRVIALSPQDAGAHGNLGNALRQMGQMDAAEAAFRQALRLHPASPTAHNALGDALREQGRVEEAIRHHRQALALQPRDGVTYNLLGLAQQHQGQLEEAVASYRQALALSPGLAGAHSNLGTALQVIGQPEEAVESLRKALELQPNHPDFLSNLGSAQTECGRLAEAMACFRQAIALRPDHAVAHLHLGMALLGRGDFPKGWTEYEWRWRCAQTPRDFPQPRWRGEHAAGRRLLLHAEQGLGDTLQFCRYAELAAERGLRVVMEVQPSLRRLLQGLPGTEAVLARGEPLPEFDLHCPLLSLPLAFGTLPHTIPQRVPYLRAEAAEVLLWRQRLEARGKKGPRIGIAWAGSPKLARDRLRSIDPALLVPLLNMPGLHFINLQKGGTPAPAEAPLTDLMPEVQDFAETAALMASLDLIISVDTAVAHLAGALGKPVWMLDRFAPDWRWLEGRADSPWYPTMRIYRQPAPRQWGPVLEAVQRDLRRFYQSDVN